MYLQTNRWSLFWLMFCLSTFILFQGCGHDDDSDDDAVDDDDNDNDNDAGDDDATDDDAADDDSGDDDDTGICSPEIHETQGYQADTALQRYRFVGGSLDGTTVAVLYSHFGPSSWAPFVNLFGYRQGSRTALFHLSRFMMAGGEAELSLLEEQILADGAAEMDAAGIVAGENLPVAVEWCAAGESVLVERGETLTYGWRTFIETCPDSSELLQWQLCDAENHCLLGPLDPDWDCGGSPDYMIGIEPWDIFVAGDTTWIAARRQMEPLTGLYFDGINVAGDAFLP